jgi:YfiH family protein
MLRRNVNGLVTYHFETMAVQEVVHAVFTRLGGVSHEPFATLNIGHTVGDDEEAVAENLSRMYRYLGLGADCIVTPHQVHGSRVGFVTRDQAGDVIPNTDGLATTTPQVGLLLRFADCQPILLYDPPNQALALVHAGWRGVAQAIARRAVEGMQEAFGTRPQELIAGLGPAIGPCCYSVGQDVASAMGYVLPDWEKALRLEAGTWFFDLPEANGQQLKAAGVQNIEQAHICTACHVDEFFSHRAEGGRTGRFGVMAFLATHAQRPGRKSVNPQEIEQEEPDTQSLHPPGLPAFEELRSNKR